jgi:hypothetical protein
VFWQQLDNFLLDCSTENSQFLCTNLYNLKMQIYKSTLILFATCAFSASGQASPFLSMSPSSLAMSGTQTGIRTGMGAMQGNPAVQALDKRFTVTFPFTAQFSLEGDILDSLPKLNDAFDRPTTIQEFFDKIDTIRGSDPESIGPLSFDILEIFDLASNEAKKFAQTGHGFQASLQGGIHFNWARFGLGFTNEHHLGAEARYDNRFRYIFFTRDGASLLANGTDINLLDTKSVVLTDLREVNWLQSEVSGGTELQMQALLNQTGLPPIKNFETIVVEAESMTSGDRHRYHDIVQIGPSFVPDSWKDNNSGVLLRWLDLKTIDFSYGFSFFGQKLHVAPVIKYLRGETSAREFVVIDAYNSINENKDLLDEIQSFPNSITSHAVDLDFGMLYTPGARWTLGLTGGNLFSPSFNTEIGGDIQISPSIRAGTSFRYSKSKRFPGTVAMDADILSVDSVVLPGAERRMISLGISQGITSVLTLSGGMGRNLAGGDGFLMSTGLGLRIKYFYLDTAISASTDTFKILGKKIPSAGSFGFALGWNMNL